MNNFARKFPHDNNISRQGQRILRTRRYKQKDRNLGYYARPEHDFLTYDSASTSDDTRNIERRPLKRNASIASNLLNSDHTIIPKRPRQDHFSDSTVTDLSKDII
jgi:hypothetical protein